VDWTSSLFFKRETVSLWSMHEPFNTFKDAAGGSAPTATPAAPREPDTR
jgi:hypothetical protein